MAKSSSTNKQQPRRGSQRGAAESRGKATSRNRVGRVWDADAESNGQDNSVKKNRKGSSGGSNNNTWRGLARLASCILGPKRSEEVVKKIVRDHPALQEKLAKGRARSGKASSRSRKPRELKKPDLITNGMTREHLLCVCVEAFGKPVFDSVVKPVVGRNGWGHNKEMILMAQILTKCWQWTRPMTETEAQSCFVRPGNQQIETTMQFREWNKDRPILTELPPEEQAYKWVYDAEALELPLLQVSLSSSAEEDIFIADTAMTSSHQSGLLHVANMKSA